MSQILAPSINFELEYTCWNCNRVLTIANFYVCLLKNKDYLCRTCVSNRQKKYRQNNPDKMRAVDRKTRIKNWKARVDYRRNKRHTDPMFKLKHNLQVRFQMAIKSKYFCKDSHFKDYIGYTLPELKLHIENQFKEGMYWNNHGKWDAAVKRWQIDHIIPLDSAKTPEELYKLCHYTNLQPLWAAENFQKGKKINIQS